MDPGPNLKNVGKSLLIPVECEWIWTLLGLKYIFISVLSCLFLVYIYYELIKRNKLYNVIQNISEKYNYQLKNVEINSLQRINKSEIKNIVNKYYNQSIFLLPLEKISNSINQISWVKDVNLSTNFKDKLFYQLFWRFADLTLKAKIVKSE